MQMTKEAESRGQKAGRKRFGDVTPGHLTECADTLREIAVALQALAREMEKADMEKVNSDGAMQHKVGMEQLKLFRKNVAMAIAKAKAEQ